MSLALARAYVGAKCIVSRLGYRGAVCGHEATAVALIPGYPGVYKLFQIRGLPFLTPRVDQCLHATLRWNFGLAYFPQRYIYSTHTLCTVHGYWLVDFIGYN